MSVTKRLRWLKRLRDFIAECLLRVYPKLPKYIVLPLKEETKQTCEFSVNTLFWASKQ